MSPVVVLLGQNNYSMFLYKVLISLLSRLKKYTINMTMKRNIDVSMSPVVVLLGQNNYNNMSKQNYLHLLI